MKGMLMVKIIQMSIILTYDVTGKLWEIPKKLEDILLFEIRHQLIVTYKVARTNNMVRLTWMTMST